MFKSLFLIITIASTLFVRAQSDFVVGLNGNVNYPNGKFTEYFNTGYGGAFTVDVPADPEGAEAISGAAQF